MSSWEKQKYKWLALDLKTLLEKVGIRLSSSKELDALFLQKVS